MQLVDANGTAVASYDYDPYGKVISATGTMAEINPIRYRGYYYDVESGLYYVATRYYAPEKARFINADDVDLLGANGDFASLNLFAYCGNSPVARADNNGHFWNVVIGAVVGAAVSAVTTAVQTYKESGEVDITKAFISGAVGAVSGGIAATGLGAFSQAGYTMLAAAGGDFLTQMTDVISKGAKYNPLQTLKNTALAGACSLLGSGLGYITSYGNSAVSAELLEKGSEKAAQAIINNSIGRSSSKLAQQAQAFFREGIKQQNIARGISSVTGTLLTWGLSVNYSA